MMRLPAARYLAPGTVGEAARALADSGQDAALVAGGTDLYPNMKRQQVRPAVLIGLRRVRDLGTVRLTDDGALAIGAGITLSHLAAHPLVREHLPALADAVDLISTPLLRNMGTLGGNLCLDTRCHFINQSAFWRQAIGSCLKDVGDLCRVAPGSPRCWAISSADLPPLLMAAGATIRLVSARGERILPLGDLYRDDGIRYLGKKADEILTEVLVPRPAGLRAGYLKLRRRDTFDFPALGVGAALQLDRDGTCMEARIVLGAVTSRPLDMPQARMLVGAKVTPERIEQVAGLIAMEARPLQLADYTHSYRKQMAGVYVSRLLKQLVN